MERKLIYADELEKVLIDKGFYPALVKSTLEKMKPVDAVEVERCEDCRFFKWGDYCTHDKMEHSRCRNNDFCSYGERRTDNE